MKTAREMREITNIKIEEIAKTRFVEAERVVEEVIAPQIEAAADIGKERISSTSDSTLLKDIMLILKQYGYTVEKMSAKTIVINW